MTEKEQKTEETPEAVAPSTDSTPEKASKSPQENKPKEEPAKEPETPVDTKEPVAKPDVEQVKKQLVAAAGEVDNLKAEIAAANKKKETVFLKKQEVGGKIAEKIKKVGDFKAKRNDLTRQVRELKKKRDELNTQINARVKEIKVLTKDKAMPFPKRERGKDSPGGIKKQIEQLEYKLETQPMSFAAEQKLNKTIRDLQKKYKEHMKQFEGMEEVMAKSKEIDDLKRAANELHAQVTKLAQDSQKNHELLIDYSKEIDDLKKEEEELYQSFLEHKKVFAELSAKLRTKMGVVHEVKSVQRDEKVKERKKKEAADKKTLKERAQEAEEKVKKKQKLTTEDLLALQGGMK